jgi:rod shape determining protein RodA
MSPGETLMATRVETAPRAHLTAEVGAFLRHLDYLLLAVVGAVVAYGLWVLADVTRHDVPGEADFYLVRQSVYVVFGAVALAAAVAVNPDLYRRLGRVLYGLALFLLLVVLVVGDSVRGSKRWIEFGSFNFQPSELGKVLLILFLAGFIADRARRIGEWKITLGAVALAVPPILLIFKEPDFGTAMIYAGAVAAILFLACVPWMHVAALTASAAIAVSALVWLLPAAGVEVLQPYQVDRLTGFLHPDVDPSGTTYNVNQSITAVGSGGLDGRGVGGATQTNMNYLPEHKTDFIFSALAEQRGFLGASVLLLLYALIAWRGIKVIAIARDLFSAMVAGAIVATFLFQVFVNVGMTIGIAPITGIPLPFVSFGGSSLITMMFMVGLLEAIHVRGRLAGRS